MMGFRNSFDKFIKYFPDPRDEMKIDANRSQEFNYCFLTIKPRFELTNGGNIIGIIINN